MRPTPSPRKCSPSSISRPVPFTVEFSTKMMSLMLSTSPAPPAPFSVEKSLNGEDDVPSPPAAAPPFTYQIMWAMLIVTVPVELAGTPNDGWSVTTYWNVALVTPAAGLKLNVPFAFIDSVPEANVQSNGAVLSAQPTMPVTTSGSPSASVSLCRTPLPAGVGRLTGGGVWCARPGMPGKARGAAAAWVSLCSPPLLAGVVG